MLCINMSDARMRDNLSHHLCYVCFLFSVDSGDDGDVPAVSAKAKKRKVEQAPPAQGIYFYNNVFIFIYDVYKYVICLIRSFIYLLYGH